MISDFFELIDHLRSQMPIRLEIECSRYTDWCITVTRKYTFIVAVQDADVNKCFEKAYTRLKKWVDDVREED